LKRIYAKSAEDMAPPGCPELAFLVASMINPLITFTLYMSICCPFCGVVLMRMVLALIVGSSG
jgi:hypothetical protein